MFRFRFRALLEVRRREEERAARALAHARLRESAALDLRAALTAERDRAARLRAAILRELAGGTETRELDGRTSRRSDGSLVAILAHELLLERRLAAACEAATVATRGRLAAARARAGAERPRRALELLEARERAAYELASGRRDAAALDEANARLGGPPA